MSTFSTFNKDSSLTTGGVVLVNKGITHLEDLSADDFIATLKSLSDFRITEKLDGNNLVFGFDMDGRFYTSRESKHGDRIYRVEDYTDRAADDAFKQAHTVLSRTSPYLREVLDAGDAIEAEILFGVQPNAIKYGKNTVVFLRSIPGDNGRPAVQEKIELLDRQMGSQFKYCTSPVHTSVDGITIIEDKTVGPHQWRFRTVPVLETSIFTDVDIADDLYNFGRFLRTTNGNFSDYTNGEIINVNLTSVPKADRVVMKGVRETMREMANKYHKIPIKNKFLNEVLRVIKPALQSETLNESEDLGVEGVVLLNEETLQQVKIVDKQMFTMINNFNHAIRNQIKNTSRGRKAFEGMKFGNGIVNQMYIEVATAFELPMLKEYISIKRGLRKFQGKTLEETLDNIIVEFPDRSGAPIGAHVATAMGIVQRTEESLLTVLDSYLAGWKSYSHLTESGKQLKYNQEIHSRTLIVFAETRQFLQEITENLIGAGTLQDLVLAFYEKQLKSL